MSSTSENSVETAASTDSTTDLYGLAETQLQELSHKVDEIFPAAVADLKKLVAIPGIAWEGQDPGQLDKSAEKVAGLIRDLGLDDVQILSAKYEGGQGAPAVVARKKAAQGQPTILLYAHHDVQPPGDASAWKSEPFVATEVGERLFGRGAADDKAGVITHVSALKSVQDVFGEHFGLGVTFFIEGEEEGGSPSFRAFLEKYRDLLAADVIVIADSSNWEVGTPALTTSLRGLADGTVTVKVLEHAVHSGMFGGPILDSLTLASQLIATFHDAEGNVAIEGLVSEDGSELIYPEEVFRADASVLESVKLAGTGTLTSRLWTKPALSILAIDAPAVAVASNTLIPETTFKFSLRLAPGQDPEAAMEAVAEHVRTHAPSGAEVTFTRGETGGAFVADPQTPAARTLRKALAAAWQNEPVNTGIGGSIPFIADFVELYPQAQILVTGVEDPDARAHSSNESLHLGEFKKAILAHALLLAQLNEGALQDEGALPDAP